MENVRKKRIIVVGGGAAGILAAYAAKTDDNEVILVEKNEKLGKKLFITGKGRCNLTNSASISEFFSHIPTNPKFLYKAFSAFSNEDIIALVESMGTKLKTERGGRVFPESDRSSDVIRALSRLIGKAGVKVALKSPVRSLALKDGKICGIRLDSGTVPCDSVILATGGFSYPTTGSSGEGHVMAASLGHHTTKIFPSLIELTSPDISEMRSLKGLLLKNVVVSLVEADKTLFSEMGEMEFMSYGFGGALSLSASAHISDREFKNTSLKIDLKPALNEEKLMNRLMRELSENPNAKMREILRKLYPRQLVPLVLSRCKIKPEKPANSLTKQERLEIVKNTKALVFPVFGTRPISEAIVTRGGIPVKEIDPATMQSRLIPGLYFAGEMIDVDAYTGGYNLQIAFSTGFLAGKSAASQLK